MKEEEKILLIIIAIFLLIAGVLGFSIRKINQSIEHRKIITNEQLQAKYERLVHIYEDNKLLHNERD